LSLQNNDGGWSWWRTSPAFGEVEANKSDPYISAYVFFGLLHARNVGVPMDEIALQRAGVYLRDLNLPITNDTKGAALDDIAFIQFVLMQANSSDEAKINQLYDARDRLSPASKAFLALMLNALNPADARVRDLISNLESSAILSASSAHWETPAENISTKGSTIYTTSVVVYALAQLDSANQVVFNAVRYLAAHRNVQGFWSSGHDNAWAMMALNEAMVGFGDLHADFTFNATLNNTPLASGDVAGNQVLAPLNSNVPLEQLSASSPNLLTITRADGLGRLYYNAALKINRPVEDVQPLDEGMQIDRIYCEAALSGTTAQSKGCTPLPSGTLQLASDKQITAQLTLILPHDAYYVMVEDFIPAGTEILDRSLKTSQQGIESTDVQAEVLFDDRHLVMAGAQNKWVRRRNIKLADIIAEPWILPPADSIQGSHIAEAFRAHGLEPPQSQVASFSIPLCHHLLATGRFMTMHPIVMKQLTKHLALKTLDVRFEGIRRHVGILTLTNRTLSPLAQRFIACARQIAKPLSRAA